MLTQWIGWAYTLVLGGLALYAVYLVVLMGLYLWHRRDGSPALPTLAAAELPVVTVQIPLRNERYVVQRILEAVTALDWPRDRLQIQVLDDSTDDTLALVQAEAARLRATGVDIEVLHREHPTGYKAGALAAALNQARGEYLALFDADFCPPPDFLRRTVPYLVADPWLGMVQARWEHLNADYSWVTGAQALALDAHFAVEHIARNRSGLLINFNGTGGVWRRQAIEEAGGWQADTVAEDLDLSYRAQLAGWRALYLPEVTAPAELPPLLAAFKNQQYRWAKGATQCLRKLAGPIVRSPRLTVIQKIMALLHLSGYFSQTLLLAMILLTLPMVLYTPNLPRLTAFLGALASIPPVLYLLGQMALRRDWWRRMLYYPVLMCFGVGLAWNNTLAIVDGLCHWGGTFIRTPKFQLQGRSGDWKRAGYRVPLTAALVGELLIGFYTLLAVWQAVELRHRALIPLTLLYVMGELLMVGITLTQTIAKPVRVKR